MELGATPGASAGAALPPGLAARVVSLSVAVSAALVMTAGPWIANLGNGGACAYRVKLGRPCIGCGGTQAYRSAVAGDVARAARLNVLGAFAGVASWLLLIGGVAGALVGHWRPVIVVCLTVAAATPVAAATAWIRWMSVLPKPWP